MTAERTRIDIEAIKSTIRLLDVAKQYTKLNKISRTGECAGPCPMCGGTDRFHVKGERFYCRQCYPRGGDVIDLVMLVEELPFQDACHVLGDTSFVSDRPQQTLSHKRTISANERMNEQFQQSARRTIWATHNILSSEHGIAGQEYLRTRGLTQETWNTYQLGFGQTFHPVRREQQDAIFIPWYASDGTQITAIQHRFIDPALAKNERYSLKPGSSPVLFGLQALMPAETLVVVEGEFNCMAIHQEGYQAVSVGSENNHAMVHRLEILTHYLPHYNHVLVWFDQPEYGEMFAEGISNVISFETSIAVMESAVLDANDLLLAGELNHKLMTIG